jgi:hypothetical protein
METFTLIVWLMGNNPSAELRLAWQMSEEGCHFWTQQLKLEPRRPPSVVYCQGPPTAIPVNPVFRMPILKPKDLR